MSRHEGVSCDSCLKANFRGKRYKCLICYDYDLCATCYEAGATNTRHTPDHPMQCILTRSDFDLYYGGEAVSVEQPQSFTCPICGKMGFTEATLQEHVTSEHTDTSFEVVCPVCAALPGGEPNHVTEDFAAHLSLEHRSSRDLDEPSGSRHVRRIPHPAGRGMSSARARRSQMQFSSTGGLSALSPSNRESMDPIAELLSQLSGVRRTATLAQSNTSSQIQQLQMQLQLERQQAQAARQHLERLPRRQAHLGSTGAATGAASTGSHAHYAMVLETTPSPAAATSSPSASQFLLSRYTEPSLPDADQQALEVERADRSLFAQEMLLTTLAEKLQVAANGCAAKESSQSETLGSRDESDRGNSAATPQQKSNPQQLLHASLQQQQQQAKSTAGARKSPAPSKGQPPRNGPAGPRGGSSNGQPGAARVPSRDGVVGRGRPSSPTRRKVLRLLDERNKSSEPPPPH
ncbi:E3 ubiquitin-protein ligase KCMF1-like [Ornithodoros turicata]